MGVQRFRHTLPLFWGLLSILAGAFLPGPIWGLTDEPLRLLASNCILRTMPYEALYPAPHHQRAWAVCLLQPLRLTVPQRQR